MTEQRDRIDPDDGRQVWLDTVAAVEYLAKGPRWGLTIWDAFEGAVRWRVTTILAERGLPVASVAGTDDPDPLRTVIGLVLAEVPDPRWDGWTLPELFQDALADWTRTMADLYNDARHWPAPTHTRVFPALPIDPDRYVTPHDPLLDD